MNRSLASLAALALAVAVAAPVNAQTCRKVDIYRVSMSRYVDAATTTVDMKQAVFDYVGVLQAEAGRLRGQVKELLAASPELSAALDAAHEATLAYGRAMGALSDDLDFFDIGTGETGPGSVAGFELAAFQARTTWRLIVAYQALLGSRDGASFDMVSPLATDDIGGIPVDRIPELIRSGMSPRRSATVTENLRRMVER